jgi:hypothetical protein
MAECLTQTSLCLVDLTQTEKEDGLFCPVPRLMTPEGARRWTEDGYPLSTVEPTICGRFARRAGETVLVEVVRSRQARMQQLLSKL